ncbi:PAC2 family protein [Desulfosoma caldarium]|uniref:PAC2 family protein n=1 Tax=Desulfosoma caldarium TaxID=610254 RepID=A0A3N1UTU0_9BACT|nr:PAC2 family protein [Desulfosoma caldarium]ROQ93573.1 PAC2 family protein [Desulfosoma caldarium]
MAIILREDLTRVSKMVLFLKGWLDAGGMADTVFSAIQKRLPCRVAALMEMDAYVPASEQRPTVRIHHGVLKDFHWHSLIFYRPEAEAHHNVLFAIGPEPSVQWRRFVSELLEAATTWQCEELLLVGSLYDQIFYDEIRISGVAVNAAGYNLLRHWQCQPATYEGPASVYSAILYELRHSSMTAVNLWAHMPFYLKGPHELLVHRMMEIVGHFAHIEWDLEDILVEWKNREMEIEKILAQDPSLREQILALKKQEATPNGTKPRGRHAEVIDFHRFKKKEKIDK